MVTFRCEEEALETNLCIFHDENYLQDKNNRIQHEKAINEKLMQRVIHSVNYNQPLLCIGYYLPAIQIKGKFAKPVYFSKSKVQSAVFSGVTFLAGASFSRAMFSSDTYFAECTFSATVSFSGATFSGQSHFSGATFSGNTIFSECTFSEVSFSRAKFLAGAYFHKTTFCGEANFHGATFLDDAHFPKANFRNKASFLESKFYGNAYFFEVKFCDKSTFHVARFSADTYFSGTFKDIITFHYVSFEGGEKIRFDKEDLSKVSFMDTDITRVTFSDRARWGEKDRFKVVEEEKLENSFKKNRRWNKIIEFYRRQKIRLYDRIKLLKKFNIASQGLEEEDSEYEEEVRVNLESIKAIYRNLRENYEYKMKYDEAGKFFIREMELKRKYRVVPSKEENSLEIKQNNWLRRNFSLTGLYYNLFLYGEDLKRPALILLLPLFILSTLYWGAIDSSSSSINDGFARWFNATERTIFNLSQIQRKDPTLAETAIKTASLAILGTLLIPLRRRFERKFRH